MAVVKTALVVWFRPAASFQRRCSARSTPCLASERSRSCSASHVGYFRRKLLRCALVRAAQGTSLSSRGLRGSAIAEHRACHGSDAVESIRVTFTSGWWFILFTIKHNGSHAESRGTPYVVFRQQF